MSDQLDAEARLKAVTLHRDYLLGVVEEYRERERREWNSRDTIRYTTKEFRRLLRRFETAAAQMEEER